MENEDKNQEEKKQPAQSMWKELWDYAKIIIVVFVIAFLLGHFVYINARVPSGSMEQTIMTGDRVFGNRLAYKTKDPERFDIVIFKYPDDPSQLFVKRVIGLPGETVNISTIQKNHWMTVSVRKHLREVSDHTRYRKAAISCWVIIEITVWIPVTGRIRL